MRPVGSADPNRPRSTGCGRVPSGLERRAAGSAPADRSRVRRSPDRREIAAGDPEGAQVSPDRVTAGHRPQRLAPISVEAPRPAGPAALGICTAARRSWTNRGQRDLQREAGAPASREAGQDDRGDGDVDPLGDLAARRPSSWTPDSRSVRASPVHHVGSSIPTPVKASWSQWSTLPPVGWRRHVTR